MPPRRANTSTPPWWRCSPRCCRSCWRFARGGPSDDAAAPLSGQRCCRIAGWLPATTTGAGIRLCGHRPGARPRAARPAGPGAAARAHAGAARPGHHRGRRRGRAGGGAQPAPGRGARLCPAGAGRHPRRQQPGRCGQWRGLPAGRALPARAGRPRARGARPAGRTGPAPARGRALAVRRTPPVPQPARAPVL